MAAAISWSCKCSKSCILFTNANRLQYCRRLRFSASGNTTLIRYFALTQPFKPKCHLVRGIETMAGSMSDYERVELAEAKSFCERCMVSVGAKPDHSSALAEVLVCGDYRGHYSHGMNRLEMYVKDIKSGTTVSDKEPIILKELAGTAWVDGNNLLGPWVGKFCMDLAMKKSKDAGIGMVVAKGSNHFGIAGWYSLRCVEAGMIGMAFTNTSPLVVPTRGRKRTMGTNPIAMCAPAADNDQFALDMATSTCALGKVELNDMKEIPIPKSWGSDAKGQETTDPKEVITDGGLMPLGGTEEHGGYKGYGLAVMVEILCGILGGAQFGPFVRQWKTSTDVANLGQCFIAINPEAFAPGFDGRMSTLLDVLRDLEPAEGETQVLVAGDPEKQHMQKVDKEGGVLYHKNLIKQMGDMAKSLGVEPMKTKQA